MKKFITICAVAAMILAVSGVVQAAVVSGDPTTDSGWTLTGHSLADGTYVQGSANYGYNAYGAGFAVEAGSNLEISDGALSWLTGDTVVGVGGQFESITPAEAGWSAFSGNAVNSLLAVTEYGPKLQVKFGTSAATWSTSTVAPASGNGSGGSSAGGGRVQVRTSGYFHADTPIGSQVTTTTWSGNSGQLMLLDKDSHIAWDGGSQLDKEFARVIWLWDGVEEEVSSWQLLLNVSLMARQNPTYTGLLPSPGDLAIMTVQERDSSYTNALVSTPEPATMSLLALGGLALLKRRRKTA